MGSLGSIHVAHVTSVGLILVLPASYFDSLLLLAAAFALALLGRELVWLLALQVIAQVLILFGTPSFVEDGPREQSAWRLAGIVDYISQHHSFSLGIDAFFNWPGFFILQSFLTRAAGLTTPLDFARWAPLFFNLAYALPLALIFRALTLSRRQIWLALWLFFAGNWIGQDYLSPQAFAYFIYLTILGVLLSAYPPRSIAAARAEPAAARHTRVALVGLVLLLFALIVPSHQLTPWVVVVSVAALVLVRRLPSFGLPVLLLVMVTTWVAFFAGPFLTGNFKTLVSPIGSVGGNVHSTLINRFTGDSGHLLVVRERVLFTLVIALVAGFGLVRLRRDGASIRPIIALTVAPALGLAVQSYGGELLLRVFLFALPFLALGAAAALAPAFWVAGPSRLWRRRRSSSPSASVSSSRGTATRKWTPIPDRRSPRFASSTRPLPAGRLSVSANDNLPWKFEHYVDYTYVDLSEAAVGRRLGQVGRTEHADQARALVPAAQPERACRGGVVRGLAE